MTDPCRIESCEDLAHNQSSLCLAHIQIGRAQLVALGYVEQFDSNSRFNKSNQSLERYKKELTDSVKQLMGPA